MDDQRIGAALRAIRIRKRWRQTDLATRAGVSPTLIGRIERGAASTVTLGRLRKITGALGARLDSFIRFDGAELPRLLDARHSAMHEAAARLLSALDGWTSEPEVSFSIYGERGIIDILAWHPGRRMLLVIELKTEIVELGVLLGKMDQRRRLAAEIAERYGWQPRAVSTWVVVADGRTNRRALAAHRDMLRRKFPIDGRGMRRWLRNPQERVDALSFLPYPRETTLGRGIRPVKRVSVRRSRTGSLRRGAPGDRK